LDDSHELISLLLGLLCQSSLSIKELLLSSIFEVSKNLLLILEFFPLFLSSNSFTLFEGSLGPKGIDFSLPVLGFLLELPESLHFTLLLLLDATLLSGLFLLS